MSSLNFFYCLLGVVFVVLGFACLAEKYKTVRGGTLLPAQILACEKEGPRTRKGHGGYRFLVRFDVPGGATRTAATNDAFWFKQNKKVGGTMEIWYNPATPDVVERKNYGTEALSAFFVALGVIIVVWLGLM